MDAPVVNPANPGTEGTGDGSQPHVPAPGLPATEAMLAGLAIAFAAPFLSGVAIRIAGWFGADLGGAVLTIRLISAVAAIAALVVIVRVGEGRLLGSIGIRRPAAADLTDGLAVAAGCLILAILVASIFFAAPTSHVSAPLLFRLRVLFPEHALPSYGGALVYGLAVVALAAIAQELAMRGFAASRLRTFTGSALIGGAAALALDLLANLPLWGVAYTVAIAPVEALLVGTFLWKRRLLPCIVADFALGTFVLIVGVAAMSPQASTGAPRRNAAADTTLSQRESALKSLNRALESEGPAAAFVKRASQDASRGDYAGAEAEMDKAIAAQPNLPALYVYRGDLYSAQNRHEPAIADYGKAIELLPQEAALYQRRGNEYVKAGNDVGAHRDFAKAIRLKPDDADTYIDRSALYARETRYEEAVRDVGEALKLEPNRTDFLFRRSRLLDLAHQYDQAIADCNRIIAINSSFAEGYACRAQEEMVKGEREQAIVDLGEVLRRAPNNQEALIARADLELQLEQWSAARADLIGLSGINSVDPETADWAAWPLATSVYPELRDGKAAVALATRACEATGFTNQKYLETLAASYAESGDFRQAIKWQQRAISVASDANVARLLRWQLGKYEKGIPYREDDSGPVTPRSGARLALAAIATALAIVGLLTVITLLARLARAGLGRATA